MDKFERIVREPMVMGGQARIRDTEITVNEIVRLSLDGLPQLEILARFPMLETEDVYQALGWHSDFLIKLISNFANDLHNPVGVIEGYVSLIQMDIQEGVIDSHSFDNLLEKILNNAMRISFAIDDLRLWTQLGKLSGFVRVHQIHWKRIEDYLDENDLEKTLSGGKELKVSAITNPERIISLLCNLELEAENRPRGKLSVKKDDRALIFTIIHRDVVMDAEIVNSSRKLELIQLLILNSGSELKIRQEGKTVIFEFALPIFDLF
jgi:uncharacterized protein (DUF433 family)